MCALVVGFDLDMTLVDSSAGIAATYRALTARTGVPVDAEAAVGRLGPPLREELARWFPPDQVEQAVRDYRELYPTYAYQASALLPGAAQAVTAVRDRGGRVVVITSKLGRLARGHLDHLGLEVDEVVGDRFGPGKAAALQAHRVAIYVGDHVADMRAATVAGAHAVGVTTGPCHRQDLVAAGAHVVLADLRAFPRYLADAEFAVTHADTPGGPG